MSTVWHIVPDQSRLSTSIISIIILLEKYVSLGYYFKFPWWKKTYGKILPGEVLLVNVFYKFTKSTVWLGTVCSWRHESCGCQPSTHLLMFQKLQVMRQDKRECKTNKSKEGTKFSQKQVFIGLPLAGFVMSLSIAAMVDRFVRANLPSNCLSWVSGPDTWWLSSGVKLSLCSQPDTLRTKLVVKAVRC